MCLLVPLLIMHETTFHRRIEERLEAITQQQLQQRLHSSADRRFAEHLGLTVALMTTLECCAIVGAAAIQVR